MTINTCDAPPTQRLFDTLAQLPGITPIESAIGYRYGSGEPQEIEWYAVRFTIAPSETGWRSLGFVNRVVNYWLLNDSVAVRLMLDVTASDSTALCFEWLGCNGHDPAQSANLLKRAVLTECSQ